MVRFDHETRCPAGSEVQTRITDSLGGTTDRTLSIVDTRCKIAELQVTHFNWAGGNFSDSFLICSPRLKPYETRLRQYDYVC